MIVAAVILSGVLPGLSAFQNAEGAVKGIHILGEVTLTFPALIEIVLILLAAFLVISRQQTRVSAEETILPGVRYQEVAVLFIGIFITMQPALDASESTWTAYRYFPDRMEMFWATGALSSFLDNTPTYLVFLTTAGTLGFTEWSYNKSWHSAGQTACLRFPVVRYLWEPTHISVMLRTLWSSLFLTRTVSICRPSSDT